MGAMEPISGVSLEKYAELCAAMAKTGEDTAAQVRIAAEAGVDADAWESAKQGWTARMQDPALEGKVAHAFYPLYQKAQSAARGGAEPMSLEQYTRAVAEYSFEKDADGNRVPTETVLARYGHTVTSWAEVTGYWTPKVNDPADPACASFKGLMQQESDRIFGIDRSAPDPDDAPAEPTRAEGGGAAAGDPPADGLVGVLMGLVKRFLG